MALQGAFAEHEQVLRRLGAETFQVRQLSDWQQPKDGVVLPGGESTVQVRLLRELGLLEPVRSAIAGGLPVLATCAGLILLAKEEQGQPRQGLCTMDIDVCRNAYGRQLGSFWSRRHCRQFPHDLHPSPLRAQAAFAQRRSTIQGGRSHRRSAPAQPDSSGFPPRADG